MAGIQGSVDSQGATLSFPPTTGRPPHPSVGREPEQACGLMVRYIYPTSSQTGMNGEGKRPDHQGLSGFMHTINPLTPR